MCHTAVLCPQTLLLTRSATTCMQHAAELHGARVHTLYALQLRHSRGQVGADGPIQADLLIVGCSSAANHVLQSACAHGDLLGGLALPSSRLDSWNSLAPASSSLLLHSIAGPQAGASCGDGRHPCCKPFHCLI